jgi:DNA-binding XRE family transcriptional regulator
MKLEDIRRRQFLSRDELARRAGVSPTTIMHIEQGKVMPKMRTARRIAAALGIEPAEIDEFRALIEPRGKAAADIPAAA